jgi:hypothetical protein
MSVTGEMVDAAFSALTPVQQMIPRSAMQAAIEAAMQAAWVSVDDSLPPLGEMVLAYRQNAHMSNDPHYKITFITDRKQISPTNIAHKWDCWCEVSHWMPLPEYKSG